MRTSKTVSQLGAIGVAVLWLCAASFAQPQKAALLGQWADLENASNPGNDRLAIADAMCLAAGERRAKGQPYYSDLLREAARVYEENGMVGSAIGALRDITQDPESEILEIEAWKWLGHLQRMEDPGSAEEAYRTELQIIDTRGLQKQFGREYVEGSLSLASLLSERKRGAESVAIRTKLLSNDGLTLEDRTKAYIYIENGRDQYALGNIDDGWGWWNKLFSSLPAFGYDDGTIVSYRLEAARRGNPQNASDEYVSDLYELWQDQKLAQLPQCLLIGNNLGAAILAGKAPMPERVAESLQVKLEMMERYFENEEKWNGFLAQAPEPFAETDRRSTAAIVRSMLAEVAMGAGRAGQFEKAIEAADVFLDRYGQDELAPSVTMARDKAFEDEQNHK